MTREHTGGLVEGCAGQMGSAHYGLGWGKRPWGGKAPGSPRRFEYGGATGTGPWIDPDWDLVFVHLRNQWEVGHDQRIAALQAAYSALQR